MLFGTTGRGALTDATLLELPMRYLLFVPLVVVFMAWSPDAHADYSLPPLATVFAENDVAIVDVTVVGFDNLEAVVEVHEVLRGTFAGDRLFDVMYACFGGTLSNYGVEEGQRYIILVVETKMMEETSRFVVNDEGDIEVGRFYADWLGLPGPVVDRDTFVARVSQL